MTDEEFYTDLAHKSSSCGTSLRTSASTNTGVYRIKTSLFREKYKIIM